MLPSGPLTTAGLPTARGRTVDFKNTVAIMTSNIGSQYIQDIRDDEGEMRQRHGGPAAALFRPEFLNRVDEIIIFHPLDADVLKRIVDIQVGRCSSGWLNARSG